MDCNSENSTPLFIRKNSPFVLSISKDADSSFWIIQELFQNLIPSQKLQEIQWVKKAFFEREHIIINKNTTSDITNIILY